MIDKKFVKLGRSWGIIVPPILLQLLKINPQQDEMVMTIENEKIILQKKSE